MQLTKQHVIDRTDPRYAIIDEAAFKSKNLYNASLYLIRQSFILEHIYLDYEEVNRRMKLHEAYKDLPAKVSQQVLRLLHKNWKSYFKACEAYREDSSKFRGHPKLPKYKDKTKGRNILIYVDQAIDQRKLRKGILKPSLLPIEVQTKQKEIDQVRIVPKQGFYVVEVVYTTEVKQAEVDPKLYDRGPDKYTH